MLLRALPQSCFKMFMRKATPGGVNQTGCKWSSGPRQRQLWEGPLRPWARLMQKADSETSQYFCLLCTAQCRWGGERQHQQATGSTPQSSSFLRDFSQQRRCARCPETERRGEGASCPSAASNGVVRKRLGVNLHRHLFCRLKESCWEAVLWDSHHSSDRCQSDTPKVGGDFGEGLQSE